jgi:UDP-glucose 4-epimerase
MARTVLVTGGAGFIGSHVADLLVADGHAVTVLDNLTSGKRSQVPREADFYELDITSPEAAALVRDTGFDVICHLAAQIDVRKSVADPANDSRINIGGSLNLLEAVRQSGADTRFIFSSTGGAVYGDLVPMPVEESGAKDPQSPYGTAKLSVEYYMGYYARVHGLDTVALRYSNVYGPGRTRTARPASWRSSVTAFSMARPSPSSAMGSRRETTCTPSTWRARTGSRPPPNCRA